MKKKNKKEDYTLCIKYASNCKYCPKYKKCSEELVLEKRKKSQRVSVKATH